MSVRKPKLAVTCDHCGQPVSPASLSPKRAREMGLLTSDTSGPTSTGWSAGLDLSYSLASRLHVVAEQIGSPLYAMSWRSWATLAGMSIYRLVSSARPMNVFERTGWRTTRTRDSSGQRWRRKHYNLQDQARHYALMRGLTDAEVSQLWLSTNFCRRIMGLPATWEESAPTETPSLRR